jgi:hypothetical protein
LVKNPAKKIKSNKKIDIKKVNSSKKNSKEFRWNKLILSIIIIIFICIIIFLWFFVLTGDVVKAQLIIESGNVEIKHNDESWIIGKNGMVLYQSDIIKTGNNTEASVVLFESSIVRLDSNSEIMLKEILVNVDKTSVTIEQTAGRTWNTVLKVSGIDDYEVQTPTTVASVRGTSFDIYLLSVNTTDVGVGKGIVFITKVINDNVVDSIELKMNQAVSVYSDNIDQILKIKDFVFDDWVLKNLEKDETFKSDVKADLYERIDPYIDDIKERWGVTDDELDVLVTGYINGNFDLPSNTPDWIVELLELS